MHEVDSIIHASWVLPVRPENKILQDHSVAVQADKIVAVMPTKDIKLKFTTKNDLDLSGSVLLPGLINCHTHAAMNVYRSMADDLPFMQWLQDHVWPAECATMNPELVSIGSKLACAEMLRSGTTCFNDHYFFPDVTAKICAEIGIRANLGIQMMDIQTAWADDAEDALNKGLTILEQEHPGLITWALAPHAPYSVSDHAFTRIKQVSESKNLKIHLHLHESEAEIEQSLEKYGKRPIARLDELGLINDKLIAVHAIQLTSQEIDLLAQRKVCIVHCPESNMKLGTGFMPLCKMKQHKLNIALGTDGAVSNNDLDMFGELRSAIFITNGSQKNPVALTAPEAIEMATINGAIALGLDNKLGSLEPGKQADMISVDLSDWLIAPTYNPFSQLAYSADRRLVKNSWVSGQQVVKDGSVLNFNIEDCIQQLKKLQPKISKYII